MQKNNTRPQQTDLNLNLLGYKYHIDNPKTRLKPGANQNKT